MGDTGRRKVNPKPSLWERLTKKRKKKNRRNPEPDTSEAENFYEQFHWGNTAEKIVPVAMEMPPEIATELGELVAVTYRTVKDGERATWEHEFGEEGGKRPTLVADPVTKKLFIAGGDYTITAAGIEN